MKKTFAYSILLLTTAILIMTASCRRASHNGKIDGLWRIVEITYTPVDGESYSVVPEDKFIAITLELLQLDNPSPQATAIISYDKEGKTLGLDFATDPKLSLLQEYGVMENPCTFRIETLSDKKMVLKSTLSTISCTKF